MPVNCEMSTTCTNPVTHIGNKGYIYCTEHATTRRGYESTRALRVWERKQIEVGQPVKYTYLRKTA